MAKVVSVKPKLNGQGQHEVFNGQNGASYKFWYELDNGMSGEVGHLQQTPRFNPGDEVEAEDVTNPQYPQYKKLKISKTGGTNGYGGGKKGGGSVWTPEKEADVRFQGFIKNAVGLGLNDEENIYRSVVQQSKAHKRLMKEWRAAQPQQAAAPAPAPQPAPQPRPFAPPQEPPVNASVKYAAALNDDDDSLPF